MAPTTISLEVTNDHSVPVEPSLGGSVSVLNVSGDTLYYADNPQVSASNNQGSLTAGQSATFSPPQWLRSAGLSTVTVTVNDPQTSNSGASDSSLPVHATASGVVANAGGNQDSAMAAFLAAVGVNGTGLLPPGNINISAAAALTVPAGAIITGGGGGTYPSGSATTITVTSDTASAFDTVWAITLNTGAQLRNVGLVGPTVFGATGGARPCAIGGVLQQSGTKTRSLTINGFSSGIGLKGDHIYVDDVSGGSNGYGFNLLPAGSGGNVFVTNTRLFGSLSTIGVASSSSGIVGMRLANVHMGTKAYAFYRYDDGGADSQSFINGLNLDSVAIENCQQGVYYDELLTGLIIDEIAIASAPVNCLQSATPNNSWWATGTATGQIADLTVTAVNVGASQITVTQANGFVISKHGMLATDPSGNSWLPAGTTVTGIVSGSWPTGSMVLQLSATPNASLATHAVRLSQPQRALVVCGNYSGNKKLGGVLFGGGSTIPVPVYDTNWFTNNYDDGDPTAQIAATIAGQPYLAQHVGVFGTQEAWGNLFGSPHGSRGNSFTVQKVAAGQTVAQYDLVERVVTVSGSHPAVVQPATGASRAVGAALRAQTAGNPVAIQIAGQFVTVKNKTGAGILSGALVKIDTVNTGGVTTASSMSDGTVIGIATQAITAGATGLIELWEQSATGGGASGPSVVQMDSGTAPTVEHVTALTDQNALYYDQASGKFKGTPFLPFPGSGVNGYALTYQGGAAVWAAQSGGASRGQTLLTGLAVVSQHCELQAASANATLVSGRPYAMLSPFLQGDVVTNILVGVWTAGAGTVPTTIRLGILDTTGKVLAVTSNVNASGAWTTSQVAVVPLTAPFTIPTTGVYYLAIVENGAFASTGLALAQSNVNGSLLQAIGSGTPAAAAGSATDLPAVNSTLTLSSNNSAGQRSIWIAAS